MPPGQDIRTVFGDLVEVGEPSHHEVGVESVLDEQSVPC